MKTLLLFISLWASLHQAEIPTVVIDAFRRDYPETTPTLWEQGREGYLVTFKQEDGLKKAVYTPSGEWIETRTRIMMRDIPTDVLRRIRQETGSEHITHIATVQCPAGIRYRIESEPAHAVIIRIFANTGELLSEDTYEFSTIKA